MRFTKMEGAGNDYIYVNALTQRVEDPSALARAMSEYHFGVGADGLILILPSERADFRMRMFNSDGSEGAMCGNGSRCVGLYVYEKGLTDQTDFVLESGGSLYPVRVNVGDGAVKSITVDMGMPQGYRAAQDHTAVSFGSAHNVYVVCENPFEWEDFPARASPVCKAADANIEYVQPLGPGRVRMRVFERGSGETLACGSGACASAIALHRQGLCDGSIAVEMRGGEVFIEITQADHVLMTGPARIVFEGEWPER